MWMCFARGSVEVGIKGGRKDLGEGELWRPERRAASLGALVGLFLFIEFQHPDEQRRPLY